MSFKRPYTLQEVHDMLCESEGRDSPTTAQPGHSIGLHADMRTDITDLRRTTVIQLAQTVEQTRALPPGGISYINNFAPGTDSRFTSRADMVRAVHQALNSGAGQNELLRFDADSNLKRVTCEIALATPVKNIERFQKNTGTTTGGLFAHSVFMVIDRMGTGIHIQTAYPKDVRTS